MAVSHSRAAADPGPQLCLGGVTQCQAAVLDEVHAEQAAVQAERLLQRPGRGAGADEVQAASQLRRHGRGERACSLGVGRLAA